MSIAEPQIPSLQIVAEQFRAEIFAYIQSKVSDPATADDLTQETFVKVSRALAKGTTPEHFRGWLYQIARNTTIDFFTESRRFVPLEDSTVNRELCDQLSVKPGPQQKDLSRLLPPPKEAAIRFRCLLAWQEQQAGNRSSPRRRFG